MAKDPAFLFYPADASEDTQFLNRLERGAYFDILKAQKKFNRFTLETIQKVLGKDFVSCWESIEPLLKKDDNGYYIEWVDDSIEKRKAFTESRRKNRSKANNDELYIYLIKDTNSGNYKIGSSVNPERRLIELKSSNSNLELHYSFGMTTQSTESELHKLYSDKQIVNEFYDLTLDDIKHIIKHMTKHMGLHMIEHMVNVNENIILCKSSVSKIPTLLQVCAYFKEKGYTEISAKKAFDYYDANNWRDKNNKPVLNWKQKMIANWMKDENKQQLAPTLYVPTERDKY